MAVAGYTTASSAVVETWDGSSWTEVNDLNTARFGLASVGSVTAALAYAGFEPPTSAKTEDWNGVSWVELADLSTANSGMNGFGTSTNAIAVANGTTEEWSSASETIKVLTD